MVVVDEGRGGIVGIEGIGTAASSGGTRGATMMVGMTVGATGVEAGI